MDFLAQIGVGLVVLLILIIIIKSNKNLETVYLESQERESSSPMEQKKTRVDRKKKSVVARSEYTVPSEILMRQKQYEREKKSDYCIWTLDAGGRPEREIEITHYPFQIGRAEDNDLCLHDASVSSHHAEVVEEAGKLILKDCGSLNKLFVDGKQTLEVNIEDGTCVFLGNTELFFQKNEEERG